MAKRTYIGVNNLTKLGKRFYIGVGNAAKKVKKMYIGVGGFALSNAVKQSTQTGQTGSIVGTKTLPFDSATGVKPLGSTASYTMSSLLTSGDIVYTLVSGNQITYKKVTDSKTTTTGGGYTEGTETSSSSNGNTSSIYGSTTYSFNTSTGKYTLGSNSSHDLSSLYSSSQRIYTSGGSTLTSKQVTNRAYHEGSSGEYIQEYYESSPSYYAYGSVTIFIDPNSYFYSSCTKGSSAGGGLYYSLSGGEWPYSYRFNSDDEEDQGPVYVVTAGTASQATGVVKYWAEWDGNGLTVYSQTLGINGYMSGGSDPYYSYTVRTYTKGSTYTQGSSSTTYTVETYTQNASGSTSGLARLCYALGGWILDIPTKISTQTLQEGSITGSKTYNFDTETGVVSLGSTSSYSLSSLYSSKEPVYVSAVDRILTYKVVSDSSTTTTSGKYVEGSTSSTSTTSTSNSSVSGYTSYSFNSSTGQYSSAGSSTSPSYSTMYSNGTTVYTGFGSSLKYKKVTNKGTTTDTRYYYDYDWDYDSYQDTDFIMSWNGYSSYSFDSSTGQFSPSGYNVSGSLWEGESCYVTCYNPSGSSCSYLSISYDGNPYGSASITVGSASSYRTSSQSTVTTYTITTYTKGATYQPGSTVTNYTVDTYTVRVKSDGSIVFGLSTPVVTSTQTGQTGSITGSKTYSIDQEYGDISLGSTSSYDMSSLLSSGESVYTAVSSDKQTITSKKVTDSSITTTPGYYTEGARTEKLFKTHYDTVEHKGFTGYTLNKETGQFSASGNYTKTSVSPYTSADITLWYYFSNSLMGTRLVCSRQGSIQEYTVTITTTFHEGTSVTDYTVETYNQNVTTDGDSSGGSSGGSEPDDGLVHFTIDGAAQTAEPGMTWKDWANSSYNTSYTWTGGGLGSLPVYLDDKQLVPANGTSTDYIWSDQEVETGEYELLVALINFTVSGLSCQAEEGMTWYDWINSAYWDRDYWGADTFSCIDMDSPVICFGMNLSMGSGDVKGRDVIVSGATYSMVIGGGGGSN